MTAGHTLTAWSRLIQHNCAWVKALPLILLIYGLAHAEPTPSGPIVISNESNVVIKNMRITSTIGDCITITNSTNVTIENSNIGPCSGGSFDSNGIKISSSNGVYIFDSYIHPEALSPGCCDHEDGVFIQLDSQNVTIQGNVIAYGETNIESLGTQGLSVVGNFLLNPRGPFPRGANFQCGTNCSQVIFKNNYTLSSSDTTTYLYPGMQEDSVNIGLVSDFIVQGNYIAGGASPSGCGIVADTGAQNGQILSNLLLNTGQCGIGIASGGNHLLDSNKVYNTTPVPGGGNVGIYVGSPTNQCGPVTVSNNISDEIIGTYHNGYHSGTCNEVTPTITLVANTFGAAADVLLTPIAAVFPAPLIPPQPKNCVASSPYSTQTNTAPCNSVPPGPPQNLSGTAR